MNGELAFLAATVKGGGWLEEVDERRGKEGTGERAGEDEGNMREAGDGVEGERGAVSAC